MQTLELLQPPTTTLYAPAALLERSRAALLQHTRAYRAGQLTHTCYVNTLRCSPQQRVLYGENLLRLLTVRQPARDVHLIAESPRRYFAYANALLDMVKSVVQRAELMRETGKRT